MGDVIKKGSKFIYEEPRKKLGKKIKNRSCEISPLTPIERRKRAAQIRVAAARFWKNRRLKSQSCNGDESRYPDKIANYSKALPHNQLGEVDILAYQDLISALKEGNPNRFEEIPLGGVAKLTNPQAAYAFELVGPDSQQLALAAPPTFDSAVMASELVELYWWALVRDVAFAEYDTNPLIAAAAVELTTMSEFQGAKINGRVTPNTLFRENFEGTLTGPRISQFLWKDVPFVSTKIVQRYRTTVAEDNHLTSYQDWLNVQNGSHPPSSNVFDPTLRYIRNGRDLGEWVHNDRSIDGGEIACRILLSFENQALDPANPYRNSDTQVGFATFGPPHILDFVTRAARPALEAAWFQKWLVHRRLRPEEYGGRIQNQLTGRANYQINPEVLNSEAVTRVFSKYGTYLLPQAYAEGCPTHPSYPSGHSTYIGATVTILKAFFDEAFIIPDPVISSDGLSLVPYVGPALTVGGELNKLASNVGNGRIAAGIHFRSSNFRAMQLGETIAIGIMRDYRATYNEFFKGFSLTKFDGTTISI